MARRSRHPLIRRLREALPALCTLPLWLLPLSGITEPPSGAQAPDSRLVTRLKAALLIETLNAELLSHDSATATLERWCATYGLASPPQIVAERVTDVNKAATEEQRRELHVTPADAVRYRRVKLLCGTLVLSEADNWYVAGRLTPEMNRLLDTTDTPFGRVVKALDFQRHTISARVLAPVLPQGWETMAPARIEAMGEPCLPARLLEHRALLTLPDGTPFSEVVETYSGNVLSMSALGLHRSCPNQ
jgi:chorismate-pyruvate lyase